MKFNTYKQLDIFEDYLSMWSYETSEKNFSKKENILKFTITNGLKENICSRLRVNRLNVVYEVKITKRPCGFIMRKI